MQVLEQIAPNDPVLRRMSTDAVEVADAGAMVAGRAARVLEPAIFDRAAVDPDAVGDIGRIGFDELRARVEQSDAVNQRGLSARVEDNLVVPGVSDSQVG